MEHPHAVTVAIQRLPHAPAQLPAYATEGAAGMDLRLAGDDVVVKPGQRVMLPTGFCIAVPSGYEAQVRMRSGFALESGLIVPNAPGTIDSDYRGEVKVIIMNPGASDVLIRSGERIAQLVIAPVIRCTWQEVERLPQTERSSGGFGSTGKA